jgi:WD repeat-containing protein 42A
LTVKGVNFYGADSEFIVSGSDCGRLFWWDKSTQQIVNYVKADDRGIVNVLEPHPSFPILATSGLDHDIKVWSPTADEPNKMEDYAEVVANNQRHRETSRNLSLSSFEFELLLLLMNRPQNRVFYSTRVSIFY